MTGSRTNPKVEYKVSQPQQLAATVTPGEAQNKKVGWSVADSSMAAISEEGLVTVKRDANGFRIWRLRTQPMLRKIAMPCPLHREPETPL